MLAMPQAPPGAGEWEAKAEGESPGSIEYRGGSRLPQT
jgi:hypothetical protein